MRRETRPNYQDNGSRSRIKWICRRRSVRWMAVLCAVAAVAVSVGIYMAAFGLPAPIQAQLDIRPDSHAIRGTLHSVKTQEVEAGSFWVVINQLPTVEEGSSECNIEYENPDSNRYGARVSLYLEETGMLLGNTTRVDPGYYVENISMKQELAPGEYPVTARLELFDGRTPAGEMSIGITLRVLKRDGK